MLAAATAARADDAASADATPSAARATLDRLGLSGSLAFDYYSSNHGIDDREHFPGVNLDLKQRLTIVEGVRWVAEARVLAEQIAHEDQDRTFATVRDLRYSDRVVEELREGYFEISRGQWEVRGGRQLIVWGRADELNPTDVITPKNYLLLLPEGQAGYRFGVNALEADYYLSLSGIRASGVWVPIPTASIIPISELPDGVHLTDRLPAIRFEDGSAGVKLDRSGGKVDASLSYFYGYNLLPEVHIERASLDETTRVLHADVALEHERQHMIGADFATTRGRFGYRGEVAYVIGNNPHGTRVESIVPYLYYVLGIERSFFTNFSVILQYVGRWVPNRVDPARALANPNPVQGRALFLAARETFAINQQLDTVQNGWTLRLDEKFWNDTLDVELLGVHYLPRNDFFIRPRITYDLTDAWKATVGGEVFQGPRHSYLGRVQKNTGAFVELKYSF